MPYGVSADGDRMLFTGPEPALGAHRRFEHVLRDVVGEGAAFEFRGPARQRQK